MELFEPKPNKTNFLCAHVAIVPVIGGEFSLGAAWTSASDISPFISYGVNFGVDFGGGMQFGQYNGNLKAFSMGSVDVANAGVGKISGSLLMTSTIQNDYVGWSVGIAPVSLRGGISVGRNWTYVFF
ncbi:MAG: hypothetical protein GY834_08380 [Bacteroidetes bacterium]|nr:hypothetical protein [Bacteroidota bacterium]